MVDPLTMSLAYGDSQYLLGWNRLPVSPISQERSVIGVTLARSWCLLAHIQAVRRVAVRVKWSAPLPGLEEEGGLARGHAPRQLRSDPTLVQMT